LSGVGGRGDFCNKHSSQRGPVVFQVRIAIEAGQVKVNQGPDGVSLAQVVVLFGHIGGRFYLQVGQVGYQGVAPHDGLVTPFPGRKVGAAFRLIAECIDLNPAGTHYPWLDVVTPLIAHELDRASVIVLVFHVYVKAVDSHIGIVECLHGSLCNYLVCRFGVQESLTGAEHEDKSCNRQNT